MNKLALIALAASAACIPAGALAQTVGYSYQQSSPNVRPLRLQPGAVIDPYWFGDEFRMHNWRLYGLQPPPRDHRWVRYFDDAYLIDGQGRVRDVRYGVDWDKYGERWEMAGGIPRYYGHVDLHPVERAGTMVQLQPAPGGVYGGHGGPPSAPAYGYSQTPPPGQPAATQPGCACPVYGGYPTYPTYPVYPGYPAYPGYPVYGGTVAPGGTVVYGGTGTAGYGAAYPIIIETTVVPAVTTYIEEIPEEVVEVPVRQRRIYRPRPQARPRPPAGERG